MFRIWDKFEQRWVQEEKFLINSQGKIVKSNLFNKNFVKSLNSERYIIHNDIGRKDINERTIYQYDVVLVTFKHNCITFKKGENELNDSIQCIVTYVDEFAANILVNCESNANVFFYINNDVELELIGNVFEDSDLIKNKELFDLFYKQKRGLV